ncbi:hypothetical protein COB57_03520 [Candidatus Peregrinibacteria bacterium]|nr:MAG: hypothetical protein COB57_03520 [Candidatus Peregrinibacteria bacterium]
MLGIVFFLASLGELLRLSFFDRIGVLPLDLFVLFFGFFYVLQKIWKKESLQFPLFFPVLLFFMWGGFGVIFQSYFIGFSSGETFQAFAYLIRFLSSLLLIYPCIDMVHLSPKKLKKILYSSAFLVFIFGMIQLKFFPSFYDLRMHESGWDPHIGRLLSTWFDPNYLGIFFSAAFLFLLGDSWNVFKKWQFPFWRMVLLMCFLYAVGITYSRSAYLGLLAGGALFAFFTDKRLLILGFSAVLLLISFSSRAQERAWNAVKSAESLLVQTETLPDATSRLRIQSWKVGWNIFTKHPVVGVGFNTLKTVQKKEWTFMTKSHAGSGIDASVLTVLSTTGGVGGLLFLWGMWRVVLLAWKRFGKESDALYLGILSAGLALFVSSFFVNALFFHLLLPYCMGALAFLFAKKTI